MVQSIYKHTQVLAQFPEIGHAYKSASGRETRILLWGHYRIVCLRRTEDEIHILGVFDGAMELDRYLR